MSPATGWLGSPRLQRPTAPAAAPVWLCGLQSLGLCDAEMLNKPSNVPLADPSALPSCFPLQAIQVW